MLVIVFDGVFERDDVAVVVLVDEVHHAGQAGGLARAGRPGHQNQAARPYDQALDRIRHAHLLERQELIGNTAHDDADAAALLENGHAETDTVEVLDGEVGPAFFLQFLLAPIGRDALHQRGRVIVVEDFGVETPQAPMVAQHRRLADRDMQVARLEVYDRVQKLFHQNVDSHCFHLLTLATERANSVKPSLSNYPQTTQ